MIADHSIDAGAGLDSNLQFGPDSTPADEKTLRLAVLDSPLPACWLSEDRVASIAHIDYEKLRRDLTRAVARICPTWLADQREDLVQASVIRVMRIAETALPRSEGNAALLPSYLYKVAYTALVDEIRRVRRRHETRLEDGAIEEAAGTANPERTTASREIGEGIRACLRRLKRERRLAVTLYLQGHSVAEAARFLAWSAKRTENLVYRALADLRECLASKGLGT
jgi:RNA polymerase sigma-70 factor (ECF subfamily)